MISFVCADVAQHIFVPNQHITRYHTLLTIQQDAQDEIFKVMNKDNFPRYKKSRYFQELRREMDFYNVKQSHSYATESCEVKVGVGGESST